LPLLFLVLLLLNPLKIYLINDATIPRHNVYLELLGNCGGASINYEYVHRISDRVKGAPRAGFDFYYFSNNLRDQREYPSPVYLRFPISYSFLFGKRKNFFELGTGINIASGNSQYSNSIFFDQDGTVRNIFLTFGWRYQGNNILVRANLTPMIDPWNTYCEFWGDAASAFFPFIPGISVGLRL
jgi:hypothetical protein